MLAYTFPSFFQTGESIMVEVAAGPSDSATHEKVLYAFWKYETSTQLLICQLLKGSNKDLLK